MRFLLVLVAVVAVTVGATLAVRQVTTSPLLLGIAGGATGLALSIFAGSLWSRRFEKRLGELVSVIESGSPIRGQEMARQSSDKLFAEMILTWQNAVKTLQDGWQAKHEEARRAHETLAELIRMMAKAVDERATYLRGHSERVARYSAAIARKLGLDEEKVEDIRLSALLHDIGTLGIEDYLVMKDAPLAPEEFEIVKAHTVKGAAILRPIETLHDLIPGIELHHESLDGLGYPYGLKGDQIPLMARIIAVADSFDAMTTPRPYQAAMNADYVLEVMQRLSGTRFDGAVVEALGSLVRSGALEVKKLRVPVSFRMRRPAAEVV
ncbi:MAG TPA: HD-GYP domain-containing protein [Acidobacteriaceae bacterium]|nr:HD-GYP domain-containing protein [Acidobacteriaceae bacterium]